MATITQGEALRQAGFATTAWDVVTFGHPGIRKTGVFDPTKEDIADRYGVTSLNQIEYPPEQKVGAHAWGLANDVLDIAADVLTRVSGQTVTLDGHAQLDFDLVRGATERVIEEGLRMGIITGVAVTPPPAPPTPPTGPAPNPGAGLHALSPASVRVEELRSIFMVPSGQVNQVVSSLLPDWAGFVLNPSPWRFFKPFAVEVLRFYRLRRGGRRDTREIPAEDR